MSNITGKLEDWKRERAEAKAMLDAQGNSLANIIRYPNQGLSWSEKYRYYDSLIKSYEEPTDV